MSGRREKALRRTSGVSIAARRDHHAFEREIERWIERLDEVRFGERMRRRRLAALAFGAWFLLMFAAFVGMK